MYGLTDVPNSLYQPRRIPDHPLRGTLLPGFCFELSACDVPKVEIPILTSKDNDTSHKAVVMAYHYSIFVMDQGAMTSRREDLAGSMLGLLFNTVDYGQYLSKNNNNELSTYCEDAGFIPVIRVLSEEEDIRRLAADPPHTILPGEAWSWHVTFRPRPLPTAGNARSHSANDRREHPS
jgi:hypothetical protein